MALDPNIILHTQPTDFGISYDNMLKTGGDMVALQADKLKLQQMPQQFANQNALTGIQVRQAQQQEASQNALRGILSQPGAIDESGNPTPQAMQQVTAVDPNLAIKLKQNLLVQQENQQKLAYMKTENFNTVNDQIYQRYEPLLDVYKKAIKDGVPPEQAQKAFQDGLTTANGDLKQGGFMTPEQFARLPTQADPAQMENYVSGSKQHMERMKYEAAQRKEDALERHRQEQEDHARRTENMAGWTIVTDPGHLDDKGNPIQYRSNPRTGEATTLDMQPYTPTGAQKLTGPETAGAAANRDNDAVANGRIATAEKERGSPLSDAEKADIRRQARIDTKVAETVQKSEATAISDDAADLVADESLKGDWHGTTGMGRNAASMRKIADARARRAKELGLTGADLAANTAEFNGLMAAERVLGTRAAGIGLGIAEAKTFGPMVLELSEKIDRTNYPTINALELAVSKGTGGENVVRLVDALNAYKTAYAQILTRGGVPTDDARRRSDEVIDGAWSKGQIRAAVDQLGKEMVGAESAVPDVRNNLYRTVTGKDRPAQGASKPDSASPAGANKPAATTDDSFPAIPQKAKDILKANPDSAAAFEATFNLPAGSAQKILNPTGKPATPEAPTPDTPAKSTTAATTANLKPPPPEVLVNAKAAIAKGADRDAVIKKLAANGFNTDGL